MDERDDIVEKAMRFGPGRALVGVWAGPKRSPGNRPVMVMLNAGIIHRAGVSRIHVRLARALATHGFCSLRFDLSGIGDSERSSIGSEGTGLQGQVASDVRAALDYVGQRHGISRFVLFGSCSGAHDALLNADGDTRVEAVIGLDLMSDFLNWRHHVVHLRQRLFNARSWWNALSGRTVLVGRVRDRFRSALDGSQRVAAASPVRVRRTLTREKLAGILNGILDRKGRLLLIFSGGQEHNYNHDSQFQEVFPRIAAHPNVSCEFLPEADHLWGSRREQSAAIGLTTQWMISNFD